MLVNNIECRVTIFISFLETKPAFWPSDLEYCHPSKTRRQWPGNPSLMFVSFQ